MAPFPQISFHRAISFEKLLLFSLSLKCHLYFEEVDYLCLKFSNLSQAPAVGKLTVGSHLEQRWLLAPVFVQKPQSYLNSCLLWRILYKPPVRSSELIQLEPNTTIPKSKTGQWDT